MKRLFLIIFITFSATLLFAQNASIPKENFKNIFSFPSQFHLKNLKTSQSFSISTFFSSESKKSKYLTNFCNSFHYTLSSKMNLQLNINAVKYGDFKSGNDNAKILPNFQIDYSPNHNLHFRILWESFPTAFSTHQPEFQNER